MQNVLKISFIMQQLYIFLSECVEESGDSANTFKIAVSVD